MYEVVIRGGTVVTPRAAAEHDIAIEDGRIVEIGPQLQAGREEINAHGLHVFPGLIDDHVHFNEPGHEDWEGAWTGSRALAAGGGTLFFDMPLNSIPCTLNAKEFRRKQDALERVSITDFALWGGLTPGNVAEMAELAECGVIGFKAFLSNSGLSEFPRSDDFTLYEGMREAARLGLPIAVHAESEELTTQLSKRKLASGRITYRDYCESRPVLAEVEAIQRAALIAEETGAKLQIVHISSGRGVTAALLARTRGVDITIETCGHYLHFTEEDMERLGSVAKCAPPLRSVTDQKSLWSHVLAGSVDVIASDHSPAPPSMKTGDDFFAIWGGIAGVQSTFSVLLEDGHFRRGLALENIARMTADYPARRFHLEHKGVLAAGADADLTLIDLASAFTLTREHLLQRHKMSPYLGSHFRGAIRRTMLRGETIFADGRATERVTGRLVRPTNLTYATSRI